MHTHCLDCRRPLRTETSRTIGRGPKCLRRHRNTATTLDGWNPAQMTAALELITDGAIIPVTRRVWATISTDGQSIHRTAHNACTCPAGIRGTLCYHRAAVAILTA